jgi:hypothetical protein
MSLQIISYIGWYVLKIIQKDNENKINKKIDALENQNNILKREIKELSRRQTEFDGAAPSKPCFVASRRQTEFDGAAPSKPCFVTESIGAAPSKPCFVASRRQTESVDDAPSKPCSAAPHKMESIDLQPYINNINDINDINNVTLDITSDGSNLDKIIIFNREYQIDNGYYN